MNKIKSFLIGRFTLKTFTLVELTMAIAVIAIGMAGVMALLPVGLNATRDAMGDNYSASMADQFLHIIAQQCKMYNASAADGWDWTDSSHIVGKLATSPQFTDDTGATSEDSASGGINDWETDTTKFLFGNIIFRDGDSDHLPDDYKIFRIQQTSGNVIDFQASMRLWKEQIVHEGYNIPYTNAVRLCAEVSWPVDKPYSMREKKYFALEIFNNNK